MRIEHDRALITAGVMAGKTTGAPIAIEIANRDHRSWAGRDIAPMTIPSAGHADLTGAVKYGHRDSGSLWNGPALGRRPLCVAAGAVCKAYLSCFGIRIGGYVGVIGGERGASRRPVVREAPRISRGEPRALPRPGGRPGDAEAHSRDHGSSSTVGGVFEIAALGAPPGLGSYTQFDRRLSCRLIGAMGSIQAIKGVEIGPGFANARARGTQVHDQIGRTGRASSIGRATAPAAWKAASRRESPSFFARP